MKTVNSCALFEGITHIAPEFIEEARNPLNQSPAPILWLKKAGALAASSAAVAIVLLGVNAVHPAFAESLPLIGEAFRHLNSLGANASTYDGVVQAVGARAENEQYRLTATEAYCDGEYLFLALKLEPKEARLLKMERLETVEDNRGSPGFHVTIHGGTGGLVYDLPIFVRHGSCFESAPMKIKLPQPAADGEILPVTVSIGSLSGWTQEAMDQGGAGQIVSTEPLSLPFALTAVSSQNRQREGVNIPAGGLALTGWSSSPSKFSVTFSYPYFGPEGLRAAARTEDGTDLGEDIRESGDLDGQGYRPGDRAVQTCSFPGVPAGTRRVVVEVHGGESGGEPLSAVFTIDLETGEAAAASGQGGWESWP